MKPFLITILCLLATGGAALPAMAQDENLPEQMTYDPTYTGVPNEAADTIRARQRASLVNKGFIKPELVHVDVVHHSYMEDDQFGIQMAIPDLISGCFTLTPLEYEAKFVDPHYLDIKVKKYRRIAPEGSNALRKCDRGNKMSTALMVLNAKDLKSRGTQEIRFSADAGADTYKIIMDENRLELVPQSMVVFKVANLAGPLKDRIIYPFASSKMVAFHVPMAKDGEDVSSAIETFARNRSLKPASLDMANTGKGIPVFYFNDDKGQYLSQIGDKGYAEVGTITVERPYDGPQGRTKIPYNLTVFATRPGTQL